MKLNSSQKSSWGHYASTMPCSESPSSAKYAIESLSLDRTNIFGVCIHHTCTETAEKAREVLKGKKQSTHFIIDKNGDTTVELPLDKRAAACVGFNKWTWQIDVVGSLHINEPTKEQILSLTNLLEILSCGRKIVTIDKKFGDKCRSLSKSEVAIETSNKYSETYKTYSIRSKKKGSWEKVLDSLPFTVFYHGEVRPTACCGKKLICKLPEIINNVASKRQSETREA